QCADGANRLAIKNRLPGNAAVDRLPHASTNAAKVIDIGLALHAAYGDGAAPAMRADHPPAQAAVKTGIQLLCSRERRAEGDEKDCDRDEMPWKRKFAHKQKHCIRRFRLLPAFW